MNSFDFKNAAVHRNTAAQLDTNKRLREKIQELEVSNRELTAQNLTLKSKIEEHDDFIASLTHDLKNPLIGSNRVLAAIISGAIAPESQNELLEKILSSNMHMLRLIWNTLDSYRLNSGALHPHFNRVNLLALLHSSVDDFSYQISHKKIVCQLDIPASFPDVETDYVLLRRAVINLIDNAIKFTPDGGKIHVTGKFESRWLSVSVMDTGEGVNYEQRELLFKRFFKSNFGATNDNGTGLGLCLSKNLIELLQGNLEYRSGANGGAIFTITLPRQKTGHRAKTNN